MCFLDSLQKITYVSSLIFFFFHAPPPPKPGQLNIAELSYGQQGAPIAYLVSPGTSNKRMEQRVSSCYRIASSENAIKPLLPFRASNGKSVRDIGTKASHVSK